MKKLMFSILVGCQLLITSHLFAQTGTWTKVVSNAPNLNAGTILLLTDGTVMCHNATGGTYGTGWDRLTPDVQGSYVNGTWTSTASMIHDRIAFASQVLPSGEVWIAGGEYGTGDYYGEVYNPLTNTWIASNGIPTGWQVYDAPSELLYNGKVLVGPEGGSNASYDCLFYTPSTNLFTSAPSSIYNHDESQWLKLPDSSVLFVGIASSHSNRYIPQTNTWIRDANLPVSIYDFYGAESGCGLMLPNGKAIFFGATQHNAIYTPSGNTSNGTWAAASDFPMIGTTYVGQPDAPGAMMVNGHILLAVSPLGTSTADEFRTPTYFLEYDYTTNTFAQVTSIIPRIGTDSLPGVVCQQMTFLDLPDGNVLVALSQTFLSNEYWIYTPGSGPIPQGKPTINSILPGTCPNYKITGKLFNGISEGSSFGDDMQNATNYPLVRLSNGTNVYYARTSLWNRIGALQTDSLEDTAVFSLPSTIPGGTYSLVVVVNGFASNPIVFNALGVSVTSKTNISCYGNNDGSITASGAGGISPYTYSWSPGTSTSTSLSNLSAGTYNATITDNNGCTAIISVTVTQPAQLVLTANSSSSLDSASCNGIARVTVGGGTVPITYLWASGQTTASITGQCPGSYCCTATDAHGCTQTACANITTGIENIDNGNGQITIYPNPNNGQFTIQLAVASKQLAIAGRGPSVVIYNLLGQEVYTQFNIQYSTFNINLSSQPSGVYFYRIIKEDGSLAGEGKLILISN